jgi:hypothetical protein
VHTEPSWFHAAVHIPSWFNTNAILIIAEPRNLPSRQPHNAWHPRRHMLCITKVTCLWKEKKRRATSASVVVHNLAIHSSLALVVAKLDAVGQV